MMSLTTMNLIKMRMDMYLKKIILSIALLGTTMVYAIDAETNSTLIDMNTHPIAIDLGWLYLKPMSNNHTYAYYVAGTQPDYQNWHAQSVNPHYASALELGLRYTLKENQLNLAIDWLHLNSNDKAYKEGNQTINLANIEFTGPPFEMSPPVFGIRRADAKLNYHYEDIALNLEKILDTPKWMKAKIIPGINVLYLKQNLTSKFSDLVGSEPTPYTYPLLPDPSFSFQIQAISEFIGLGPSLGVNGQIEIMPCLSLIGTASGSLNVGTISVQENFTSTSARLTREGIGVSKQQITVPNKTQIVPGFDGRLGLLYQLQKIYQMMNINIEAGYRLISYINAVSTINPQTLVQPGDNPDVPEFSTGTMAIVSMTQQDRPFNMNGPYVEIGLDFL
jgi:hypothetical protein